MSSLSKIAQTLRIKIKSKERKFFPICHHFLDISSQCPHFLKMPLPSKNVLTLRLKPKLVLTSTRAHIQKYRNIHTSTSFYKLQIERVIRSAPSRKLEPIQASCVLCVWFCPLIRRQVVSRAQTVLP